MPTCASFAARATVVAAVVAGVVALAACGGGHPGGGAQTTNAGSGATASVAAPSQAHTVTASGSPAGSADEQAIRSAYVTFFAGDTPAADRVALLQNGAAFAATIDTLLSSSLAGSLSATVSSVGITGPDQASVVFTILLSGQTLLVDERGTAVREDGAWKVSDATACALSAMIGTPPAACADVPSGGPTPTR
ncbi:MAG: hypothetical protein FWD74_06595 [Actinomycetia bacterium]|nr:hypothetical protein [Actinomycetes bacterium]